MLVKVLFLIGIVVAVAVSFIGPTGILPWIVGGSGIATGIVAWRHRTPGILLITIALVVALSAIHAQPFNPHWLTGAVFFIRVFVAHVALAAGLLEVFLPGGK